MSDIYDSRPRSQADAWLEPQGRAALLLVESLIHGLIEKTVLSTADAVEIVSTACEVERDGYDEVAGQPDSLSAASALLLAIQRSLAIDLQGPTIAG